MRKRRWVTEAGLVVVLAGLAGCAQAVSLLEPADSRFAAAAPDSFDVEMVTTKGTMIVRVRRSLAPRGADRFHALVRAGFYDGAAFHRTIQNFVAQFGIPADPAVSAAWRGRAIPDDTVRAQNRRGTLSFASEGPDSRATQLFFNIADNTPGLDTFMGYGFPPIGRVVRGIEVLDSLNWEYSGTREGRELRGPDQERIWEQGSAYLQREFPRIDYILTATIARRY